MKTPKNGTILVVSLWVLAILVVFAVGIGYRTQLALKLTRYQREQLEASFLLNAGVNRAIYELEKDQNSYDNLLEPWSDNEKTFAKISFDETNKEFCTIGYITKNNKKIFGLSDEESKININNAGARVLEEVFTAANAGADAKGISETFGEWISTKEENAEEKTIFKNAPLTVKEELLLVLEFFYKDRLRAHEVYDNVKNLITVYGNGKINVNTASLDTLRILAHANAETEADMQAADNIANRIVKLREDSGFFKNIFTLSDALALNTDEAPLWNKLSPFLAVKSDYFSIDAQAFTVNAHKNAIAVFDRPDKKFVYWHER